MLWVEEPLAGVALPVAVSSAHSSASPAWEVGAFSPSRPSCAATRPSALAGVASSSIAVPSIAAQRSATPPDPARSWPYELELPEAWALLGYTEFGAERDAVVAVEVAGWVLAKCISGLRPCRRTHRALSVCLPRKGLMERVKGQSLGRGE